MYRALITGLASTLSIEASTSNTGNRQAKDSTRIIDKELTSSVAALEKAIQEMEALKARITQTLNPPKGD